MKTYEIETLTDSDIHNENIKISMTCSPGWCSPVDGYVEDNYEDKKYLYLESRFKSII
jgi:hypothetical protein